MDPGKAANFIGYDKSKGTLANNMKTVSGGLATITHPQAQQ